MIAGCDQFDRMYNLDYKTLQTPHFDLSLTKAFMTS